MIEKLDRSGLAHGKLLPLSNDPYANRSTDQITQLQTRGKATAMALPSAPGQSSPELNAKRTTLWSRARQVQGPSSYATRMTRLVRIGIVERRAVQRLRREVEMRPEVF